MPASSRAVGVGVDALLIGGDLNLFGDQPPAPATEYGFADESSQSSGIQPSPV
ncbi:hypothetical protein AB0C34_17195 [Nocardia sp. NPDC049220]|uniref:hypothetical protein n=1 Tax=Nocardia sp. NPDC049220 TaxID=3155273 RepID=UPI0033E831AC